MCAIMGERMEDRICSGCGANLDDFVEGDPRLVKTVLGSWCPMCSTSGLQKLPEDQRRIVERAVRTRSSTSIPVQVPPPQRKTTRRRRRVARTRRIVRRSSSSDSTVAIVIAVAAVLGFLVLMLAASG